MNRIGNHDNVLNDNSLALTVEFARAYGLTVGNQVYVNGQYLGNYDDTAPEHDFRIDIFDPYGVYSQNWGGTLQGRVRIDNRPYP